jgi:hypothetical protein
MIGVMAISEIFSGWGAVVFTKLAARRCFFLLMGSPSWMEDTTLFARLVTILGKGGRTFKERGGWGSRDPGVWANTSFVVRTQD